MTARGARAVSLWVLAGNDAADMFYAAVGFVPTGERQEVPWPVNTLEHRLRRSLP